jgi:hypothetical protein
LVGRRGEERRWGRVGWEALGRRVTYGIIKPFAVELRVTSAGRVFHLLMV